MAKILIIEDEPQLRCNIKDVLELADFEVVIAENGKQGLQLLKEQVFDLVVCDVMMPELDGYHVLDHLRQDINNATIPLIFLTAKSEWSDVRRGMELGADDYLTKPFQPDELLLAINTRLEKKALVNQDTQKKLDNLRISISQAIPHEINTSLNHILNISHLLIAKRELDDKPQALEMVKTINMSAQRIYKMTNNFLLYTDIELMTYNPQKLAEISNSQTKCFIKSVIEPVAYEIAERVGRIEDLKLNFAEDGIAKISPVKLYKIFEELIDNAFKFSSHNTPVEIIGYPEKGKFYLSIIDYGRGMTPHQIAMVGAYMQFDRQIYEQQGSGLGLAIAKRLVELYQGNFSIESIPGKKTMVKIILPQ
jgi:two-component system, sensor histidine kinase and response regulator